MANECSTVNGGGNGRNGGFSISDKTHVRLSVATFLAVLGLAAGLHPWLLSQVRSVVREEVEYRATADGRKLDARLYELREAIRDLRSEVRALRGGAR